MIFGMVMMCLTVPVAGQDECKVFYVNTYTTEEACLVGIEFDGAFLETQLPQAKVEDLLCVTMSRKGNV